jgi:hypothetical protein
MGKDMSSSTGRSSPNLPWVNRSSYEKRLREDPPITAALQPLLPHAHIRLGRGASLSIREREERTVPFMGLAFNGQTVLVPLNKERDNVSLFLSVKRKGQRLTSL